MTCENDAIAASLDFHYTEKDSPQPHVPLILGLLKTNSEASLGKNTFRMSQIREVFFQDCAILALLKVHLRAKNRELGFFVNEDSHPVLIHHFILRLFCLRIVESVAQTCPQKRQVFIWQRPFLPLHPRVRTPILRPSAPG